MFSALVRLLFWVDFGWGAGVTNLTLLCRMAAYCIRKPVMGSRQCLQRTGAALAVTCAPVASLPRAVTILRAARGSISRM